MLKAMAQALDTRRAMISIVEVRSQDDEERMELRGRIGLSAYRFMGFGCVNLARNAMSRDWQRSD